MYALLVPLFPLAALLVKRVPARWLNLPRRDHWLAPSRAETTRREIAGCLLAFGATMQLFLFYLQWRMVQFNLSDAETMGSMWPGLILYLLITIAGTVLMLVRFSRT